MVTHDAQFAGALADRVVELPAPAVGAAG